MLSKDIFFLSARELGRRLKARQFTSEELTRGCIERLRTIGAKLNAVVTITEERALEEARAADRELRAGRRRGPLHGVPYGVKDLLATRGIPTTWGAEPYRNQVFDSDATAIRKLHDAGATRELGALHVQQHAASFLWDSPCRCFRLSARVKLNDCDGFDPRGATFDLAIDLSLGIARHLQRLVVVQQASSAG